MKRDFTEILGIKIDSLSTDEAISHLDELVQSNKKSILCTPNTEFIIKAQSDDRFKDIINSKSKMNLADSFGVLWAGRFLTFKKIKTPVLREIIIILEWFFSFLLIPIFRHSYFFPIKQKMSGSDFIWDVARYAAQKKYRLFLFGGGVTVAERAALKLQTDVPDLRVAGVFPGELGRTEEAIEAINKSKAEILLVCLGAPLQEYWLEDNLKRTCAHVGIGLGGTFDFISGVTPRAPRWMQMSGLEWLYRLILEPKRIKRQLSLPRFALEVLAEKLKK